MSNSQNPKTPESLTEMQVAQSSNTTPPHPKASPNPDKRQGADGLQSSNGLQGVDRRQNSNESQSEGKRYASKNLRGLLALGLAVLLATSSLFTLNSQLPEQGLVNENLEYGYLYSGVKSESLAFTQAAAHEDTYFLFGSSELATMPEMVTTAPDRVFQEYDCGMQFMYIGESYDQSLWMAIAAGAYAADMPHKKLALIVSPQWFLDGGLEPGLFKMRFSYELYQAFWENESISAETKAFVGSRLIDEGLDRALVDAASPELPQEHLDNAAFSLMNDLRLRQALLPLRSLGSPKQAPPSETPDFTQLREEALVAGQAWCTNNEYGIYDSYWSEFIEPEYAARKDAYADETLTQTPEYDDFSCFLDVCEQAGLDPYVIIMPVNGAWYDYAGLSPEVRNAFYERITHMCAEREVTCLDLSPHEYDLYYMRDIMHFGWLGWLDVEEGFMEFVDEDRP